MATFEVSVTPKWKKKATVEPSPILMLERFKGTPSLLFKDLKVGQTCTKGLWIRNSNDCTVTVCMTKLPPPERGLTFSEVEFNLDALESKRVEVTWLPTCPGTWRDMVHVQVWGLPPPHLNYRVVLHLTSVEPKPKHKCCCINPPLRSRNAYPKLTAGAKKASTVPGACASCCKRNVVKNPSKTVAASTAVVTRAGGKENASKFPPKSARLIIKARVPDAQHHSTPQRRSSNMDQDSLEENKVAPAEDSVMPLEPFLPIKEGASLPPCSIPSTPIRRVTYSIQGNGRSGKPHVQSPETPVDAATFTVLEEEKPSQHYHMFLQKMKEIQFSPVTKDLNHSNAVVGGRELMPSQSSPIYHNVADTTHHPPQCSPILPHNPMAESVGWGPSSAGGFFEYDGKTDVIATNHTYTKVQTMCMYENLNGAEFLEKKSCDEHSMVQLAWNEVLMRRMAVEKEVEELVTMNSAACVIQKNWRCILAKRKYEKLRLEKFLSLNRAAIVIQKNWRYALAKKQVATLRAKRLEAMENAACVFQKNWRRILAKQLAYTLRAERLKAMNVAAIVIQRNWRHAVAKRRARKLRAERITSMNKAAIIIQRNWRLAVAKRRARKLRAERITAMNKGAIIIQRNWRHAVAKRRARKLRAERITAMNKAAIIIQRNWRHAVAKQRARKLRAKRITAMNEAAIVIQRNWRYVLTRRQARMMRAERIVALNNAACIFQKNWRCILAMRLASKLRAERKEAMNKAAIVIQRNWRYVLATRRARFFRAERIVAMNKAAVVIQKNWKCALAMRKAAKLRAERLKAMNKAACVFQKYFRRLLAVRLADKLRAERLEAMNRAACAIQKNWRVVLAKRIATQLREKRQEELNVAACVIQKNWRRFLAQRLTAALRAEKANDYSALRQEFAMKVCSKFHMEMSTFDLMHRLASSTCSDQDIILALKYIRNGFRTKMLPPFALPQCNKATQTMEDKVKEFTKPKAPGYMLRRRTMHEKLETPKPAVGSRYETPKTAACSRKCLYQGTGSGHRGSYLSPIRKKLGQKEVPEKERWSSVAEAMGCTPRK